MSQSRDILQKKTIKYLKISIVLTVLLHEINILLHFKKDNKMVCADNCMERCGVLLCKVIIMCNTVKLRFSAEAFFLRFCGLFIKNHYISTVTSHIRCTFFIRNSL